jgi:HK97 family phage major capsid protein
MVQSPVNFDEIIICDLLGSYAQQLGNQVLSGSGAAGQILGLRNVAGAETVTWTSATPTAVEFQRRVADAISRVSGALFASPNAIIMHPRRWAWLLTQNDTANRPLVVPEAYGPSNAQGLLTGGAEGRVGSFAGLPVYVDSNVPTTTSPGFLAHSCIALRRETKAEREVPCPRSVLDLRRPARSSLLRRRGPGTSAAHAGPTAQSG